MEGNGSLMPDPFTMFARSVTFLLLKAWDKIDPPEPFDYQGTTTPEPERFDDYGRKCLRTDDNYENCR